jgi:hypothetical protein
MTKPVQSLKFCQVCAVAALLVLTAVSCLPAADPASASPVPPTVEVTRTVTASVTDIPSATSSYTPSPTSSSTPTPTFSPTVTPTPTISLTPSLTPTITRTPSITPTPLPPRVTILDHIACWFGPSDNYLERYGLAATVWMNVIGRNEDGSWLLLNDGGHDQPCWIRTVQGIFIGGGDVVSHNIPIVDPDLVLPRAYNLYRPPMGIQAFRKGNKVTVTWNGVWMTEDDYEGYLIEAWLCQNGQLIFTPKKFKLPLSQNIEGVTQYLPLTDEPGCQQPSHARIYTVEKHGYTLFVNIPWPPYDATPTPSP